MRRGIRLICILLVLILLSNSFVLSSYASGDVESESSEADDTDESGGSDEYGVTDESGVTYHVEKAKDPDVVMNSTNSELREDVLGIIGALGDSEEHKDRLVNTACMIITYCRTEEWNENAIAGLLGNVENECGFNEFRVEGDYNTSDGIWSISDAFYNGETKYVFKDRAKLDQLKNSGGVGLIGFTFEDHVVMSDHCKKYGKKVIEVTNVPWKPSFETRKTQIVDDPTYFSDAAVQVSCLDDAIDGLNSWGMWDGTYKYKDPDPQLGSFAEYKKYDFVSPGQAACEFLYYFERCADIDKEAVERANDADEWAPILAKYGGTEFAEEMTEETKGDLPRLMYETGVWDEKDLSTWCRLTEMDVESMIAEFTTEDFDSSDLTGFTAWKRNIDNDLEQNGLISWIRRIVMLFGILFTVWVIIIYICYWFDRINSIFFIDALGIATFGHLHASVDGESSFRETKATKSGGKTVNHRDILFICIVGIAFGVLIISGYYYIVIQRIIYGVRWLLDKLGGA